MGSDEDVALDVAAHFREDIGAAAALDALLVRVEAGVAKRLEDDRASGVPLLRPWAPARAFGTAQPFNQSAHGDVMRFAGDLDIGSRPVLASSITDRTRT